MITSDFFSSFSKGQQAFMSTTCAEKQYKKGTYIYTPNEVADRIYIIKKGAVKIVYPNLKNNNPVNQITKSLLTKGHVFGEMILAGQQTRRDYAYIVEDTVLQIYSKTDFQVLLQSRPQIHSLVLQQISQKLVSIENRFAAIILKNSRTRIIDFLLELAQERGVKVGFDTLIRNFMSQQEIANYTITARQTVSAVLTGLRAKNLIYYTRKKLLIRDISLLQQELLQAAVIVNS